VRRPLTSRIQASSIRTSFSCAWQSACYTQGFLLVSQDRSRNTGLSRDISSERTIALQQSSTLASSRTPRKTCLNENESNIIMCHLERPERYPAKVFPRISSTSRPRLVAGPLNVSRTYMWSISSRLVSEAQRKSDL
jgi:hypothetical protein